MTSTPPISDLHDHLGYWLRAVSNAVSHGFARRVEQEGVTVAEWVFLRMLHDVEEIAPSQLAERMNMTKGAISKLADRLVDKDLISRRPNPQGGRGQILALNAAARSLVPRLAAIADQNDAEFFEPLADDERQMLETLLRKIVSARSLASPPID